MNEEKGIKKDATWGKKEINAIVRQGMYMVHRLVEHYNKIKV